MCIVGCDLFVVWLGFDIWFGFIVVVSVCEIGEWLCDFEIVRIRIGG